MSRKQVGRYLLDKRIGKGSYAQVWLGHCEDSEDTVAVKVISRHTVNETAQLRQEVSVLKRINHDNIVKFIDLKKSVGHYYLVLEYCAGGDLAKFIRSHGRIREESAQKFLRQLSAGLLTLHRLNFIHRDLKPQNILLTEDSENAVLKIADFGFARFLDSADMAATVCGSPLYMAPEILRHQRYDGRADLWSLGTIMHELMCGVPPFTGSNPMQLLATIESSPKRIVLPSDITVSEDCLWLIQAVLARDPADRISPEKFFSHPYNLGDKVILDFRALDSQDDLGPGSEDITVIEESTTPLEKGESSPLGDVNKTSSVSSEPVVVLTGLLRVLSDIHSFQTQGPLADSYAATQVGLGILLRYIAEQTMAENEEEKTTVDGLGIIVKSCEFLDNALDEIFDRSMTALVEHELRLSLELSTQIQSKLSYRGFTESAQPLRWVFAFASGLGEDFKSESDESKKSLLSAGCELLCDFLLHEFEQLETSGSEEQTTKEKSELFLRELRESVRT